MYYKLNFLNKFAEVLISKIPYDINSIFYEPKVPSIDSSLIVNKAVADELLTSAKFSKESMIY